MATSTATDEMHGRPGRSRSRTAEDDELAPSWTAAAGSSCSPAIHQQISRMYTSLFTLT
jgi:hypothetical protein